MDNTVLVITSIAGAENDVLNTFAKQRLDRGISFLVVGDLKSPEGFQIDGRSFLSIDK